MKILTTAVCLSFALAATGCSSKSDKIQPTYVSPIKYSSHDCGQLEQEYTRLLQHSTSANKKQDDAVYARVTILQRMIISSPIPILFEVAAWTMPFTLATACADADVHPLHW